MISQGEKSWNRQVVDFSTLNLRPFRIRKLCITSKQPEQFPLKCQFQTCDQVNVHRARRINQEPMDPPDRLVVDVPEFLAQVIDCPPIKVILNALRQFFQRCCIEPKVTRA